MGKTVVEIAMIHSYVLNLNFSSEQAALEWKEDLDQKIFLGNKFVVVNDNLGNNFTINCMNIQTVFLKEK